MLISCPGINYRTVKSKMNSFLCRVKYLERRKYKILEWVSKTQQKRQHKISFIAITKFILYRASGNKLRYEIASMYREIEISPILTEYKLKYIFPISKY